MKIKINLFVFLFLFSVLFFNLNVISGVYLVAGQGSAEAVQERPIDGQTIVEMIEEAVRDFWEVARLDRLFDVLITFFEQVWEWAKNVFETGLERTRE